MATPASTKKSATKKAAKPTVKKTASDKYFIPLDDGGEANLPESFIEQTPALDETGLQSFSLKPQKNPYLRPLLKLAVLCFLGYGGWQMWELVSWLSGIHWSLGIGAGAVMIVLLLLLLKTVQTFYRHQRELDSVFSLQQRVDTIERLKSFGQSAALVKDLQQLYQGKPQETLLAQSLKEMPDYNNDAEVIDFLSTQFFAQLDQQALRTITRHSQQTGLLVALSPFALADILLSLWRILKMVDEISQIYGLRPSLLGRARLAKQLLNAMALAGASEILTESLTDLGSSTGVGVLSARLAQGIGVGLYVSRIGLSAMRLCRPISLAEADRPKRLQVFTAVRQYITDNGANKE